MKAIPRYLELQSEIVSLKNHIAEKERELKKVRDENDELKAVAVFYGNQKNYVTQLDQATKKYTKPAVIEDGGSRARSAMGCSYIERGAVNG